MHAFTPIAHEMPSIYHACAQYMGAGSELDVVLQAFSPASDRGTANCNDTFLTSACPHTNSGLYSKRPNHTHTAVAPVLIPTVRHQPVFVTGFNSPAHDLDRVSCEQGSWLCQEGTPWRHRARNQVYQVYIVSSTYRKVGARPPSSGPVVCW